MQTTESLAPVLPRSSSLPDVSSGYSTLPCISQLDKFPFVWVGLCYLQTKHHGRVCFWPRMALESLSDSHGSGRKVRTHGTCWCVVCKGGCGDDRAVEVLRRVPRMPTGISSSGLPLHAVQSSIFNPDCAVPYTSVDHLTVGDSEQLGR